MDILSIYFQMWVKILQIWWPVIFSVIVGLAYIYFTEKKDKHKKEKGLSSGN